MISALPTPPSRQDPTNFNDRADAFLGALPQFQSEANALQTDVNAKQLAANYSATLAAASELAAANTAGATLWTSGTYAVGVNKFSPSNFLTYRRKIAGASSVDPASDPSGWQLLTGLGNVDSTSNQTIAGVKTFNSTIIGNVSGTAGNVTGVIDITNGGTGATTAANARTSLGTNDATNITTGNIGAARLITALNATAGSAPIYAARAWVNFNGIGTNIIRGSGNVSSVTDYGTGDYLVTYTVPMPDGSYSATATSQMVTVFFGSPDPGSTRIATYLSTSGTVQDSAYIHLTVHR